MDKPKLNALLDEPNVTLAEVRRRFAHRNTLFVHIPKTAGSSLVISLSGLFPRALRLELRGGGGIDSARYNAGVRHHASAFMSDEEVPGLLIGHVPLKLHDLDALNGCNVISFVRDPVDRVISDYYYSTSEKHPHRDLMRDRFPTIENYIEAPGERNKMFRYLSTRSDGSVEELLNSLDRFAFIGSVDAFDSSIFALSLMLGARTLPMPTQNRRVGSKGHSDAESNAALRSTIAEMNALDMALFNHIRAVNRQTLARVGELHRKTRMNTIVVDAGQPVG